MRDARFSLQPLAGPTLQLSLFVPVLLLLLVFLVATPIGSHRPYGLDPPFISSASLHEAPKDALQISIHRDGTFFIATQVYSSAGLSTKLLEYGQHRPPGPVVIRADRSLPFKVIRSALRDVQLAGATRVFLITFEGRPIELLSLGAT